MSDAYPPGAATDSAGRAALDPTKNVLDLVEAAIRRQDDLRSQAAAYESKIADLRAAHTQAMRQAEADRLNAIREIDQGQIQRAAEVQQQVAVQLAQQVSTTADAFRSALVAALEPIQKDIQDLRKTQYEQQGQRAQVTENREGVGARSASWAPWLAAAGIVAGILVAVFGR